MKVTMQLVIRIEMMFAQVEFNNEHGARVIISRWGSGCGSVGRAVASNTRGPRFESSHRQKFIYTLNILFTVNCVLKRRK